MVSINKSAESMMQALWISPERCEELCTAIEQTHSEHPDWHFGQILAHATEHHTREDNKDNEVAFMVYVFGRHAGMVDGMMRGKIKDLLDQVFGGGQHSFRFSRS